jgi:hypothetical protein
MGTVLSACQTPVDPKKAALAGQAALENSNEVASISGIRYANATFETPTRLAVSPASDVAAVNGTKRFVVGVRLPVFAGPYIVEIVSVRQGSPAEPLVLYPEAWFVDEGFEPVRRVARSEWRPGGNADGSGLLANVFVNDDSLRERYLLITSYQPNEQDLLANNDNFSGSIPLMIPIPGAVVTVMLPAGSTHYSRITAAPTGEIVVRLKPYRLRKVGEPNS